MRAADARNKDMGSCLEKSDVIVVGAGPAGCAAAARVLMSGLSVTIIDKFAFPRDKLCGGLVTGRSMRILQELFAIDPDSNLFLKTNHIRIWAGDRELVSKPMAPTMYMTMRKQFDHALLEHCQKLGANFICGTVMAISPTHITLRGNRRIGYEVLVGADGANSFVASQGLGKKVAKSKMAFGLEVEASRLQQDDNTIELDLDAIAWGYGWSFPKLHSRTIGVGGLHGKNTAPKDLMRRYREKMAPHAESVHEKGAFLPFGSFIKEPGRDNILLAGDAAGLVDPITGEGIALALESGSLAGICASKAVAEGKRTSASERYVHALSKIHRELLYARITRFFMFSRLSRHAVQTAFKRSNATDLYLKLLNGDTDYHTISRRVLLKMPVLLVRAAHERLSTWLRKVRGSC